MRNLIVPLLAVAAFPSVAGAGEIYGGPEPAPQIVQKFASENDVTFSYLGNDNGLHGYFAESKDGTLQTFYISPNGQSMVAGMLFDMGGINRTGVQLGELKARLVAGKGEASGSLKKMFNLADVADKNTVILDALEGANWFSVGKEGLPVVYMVADPKCPVCHRAWNDLKPMLMDEKIQLRVLMVSILPGSEPISRAILAQEYPGVAWLRGEGSVEGRASDMPEPGSAEFERGDGFLKANNTLFKEMEFTGTPVIAYRNPEGKGVVAAGLPRDMSEFLSGIDG